MHKIPASEVHSNPFIIADDWQLNTGVLKGSFKLEKMIDLGNCCLYYL